MPKSYKIFKPSIHNNVGIRTNTAKIRLSLYFISCVPQRQPFSYNTRKWNSIFVFCFPSTMKIEFELLFSFLVFGFPTTLENRIISVLRLSFFACLFVTSVFYQSRKNFGTSVAYKKNVLTGIMNETAAFERIIEPSIPRYLLRQVN